MCLNVDVLKKFSTNNFLKTYLMQNVCDQKNATLEFKAVTFFTFDQLPNKKSANNLKWFIESFIMAFLVF